MPKHNELNINRKHEKKLRWEHNLSKVDETDAPDFRESLEFAQYSAEIVTVLRDAKRPLTTREIHEALGDKANRDWTGEVLEWVEYILCIPGYINRYAYISDVKVLDKDALTRTNASLFVGNVQYEKRRRPTGKTWNGRAAV